MLTNKKNTKLLKYSLSPWYYNRFFRYSVAVLLVLSIVFLIYQVNFFLTPFFDFISTLFAPIIISLLFYYLLRPIVRFLERKKVPRIVAIIMIYIGGVIFVALLLSYIGPILSEQIGALINTSIEALEKFQKTSQGFTIGNMTINIESELRQRLITFLQGTASVVSKNFIDFLAIITRVATVLAVIPFIVFYLLKEDEHFLASFLKFVPGDFGKEVTKTLKNVDKTLSNYINGLTIVGLSVGTMLFFGYLIIGVKYALILSFIAIILTSIPYLGPFMAFTPALLIGLSESPAMALKVSIVFIIVLQIESSIISPQVIGHRLHIHPLTIILLLLAAGSLYGLVGLLLATPFYAITKVLLENLYKIYRIRYPKLKAQLSSTL